MNPNAGLYIIERAVDQAEVPVVTLRNVTATALDKSPGVVPSSRTIQITQIQYSSRLRFFMLNDASNAASLSEGCFGAVALAVPTTDGDAASSVLIDFGARAAAMPPLGRLLRQMPDMASQSNEPLSPAADAAQNTLAQYLARRVALECSAPSGEAATMVMVSVGLEASPTALDMTNPVVGQVILDAMIEMAAARNR